MVTIDALLVIRTGGPRVGHVGQRGHTSSFGRR